MNAMRWVGSAKHDSMTPVGRVAMKLVMVAGISGLVLGLGACSDLERSRNLADPSVPAKALALQVCSNCHGIDGNSSSPNFPRLAGQTEEYFTSQMTGFRGHSRSDPAGFEYMWGLSRHLTDEQIKDLAAYYAGQTPGKLGGANTTPRINAGKLVYENGLADKEVPPCSSCHGADGQGNGQFPRIAGQHADYLVKQLMVFQRTNERPEGSIMKTIAHGLSRENMEDVAAYLQTR